MNRFLDDYEAGRLTLPNVDQTMDLLECIELLKTGYKDGEKATT